MARPRLPWNHPTIVARFLAKFEPCPDCECVLFTGTCTRGWGRFVANDFPGCPAGRVWIHRYAYRVFRGPIPEGHDVHHVHERCNHRNCGNVDHIEPESHDSHGEISRAFQLEEAEAFAGL